MTWKKKRNRLQKLKLHVDKLTSGGWVPRWRNERESHLTSTSRHRPIFPELKATGRSTESTVDRGSVRLWFYHVLPSYRWSLIIKGNCWLHPVSPVSPIIAAATQPSDSVVQAISHTLWHPGMTGCPMPGMLALATWPLGTLDIIGPQANMHTKGTKGNGTVSSISNSLKCRNFHSGHSFEEFVTARLGPGAMLGAIAEAKWPPAGSNK